MRGHAVEASRTGGFGELVRATEAGILVPPGRPEPLARALERLLSDRELALRIGVPATRSPTAT